MKKNSVIIILSIVILLMLYQSNQVISSDINEYNNLIQIALNLNTKFIFTRYDDMNDFEYSDVNEFKTNSYIVKFLLSKREMPATVFENDLEKVNAFDAKLEELLVAIHQNNENVESLKKEVYFLAKQYYYEESKSIDRIDAVTVKDRVSLYLKTLIK